MWRREGPSWRRYEEERNHVETFHTQPETPVRLFLFFRVQPIEKSRFGKIKASKIKQFCFVLLEFAFMDFAAELYELLRRSRGAAGGAGSVGSIGGAMLGLRTARRFASIGVLALALGARAQAVEAPPQVTRVHAIATGIAACWRPPHDDDQVTVRISFTREGAVIGEPKIVFLRPSAGQADDAALARSMMAAIRDCTPLNFSARLGSAIAGQVLAIRFIGRSRATIVAPP